LHVFSGFEIGALKFDRVRYQLVLGVVGPLHLNRKSRHQSGDTHLFLASVEQPFHFVDLGARSEQDHDVSRILSLQHHGGAAASIDYPLDVLCRCNSSAQHEYQQ
jgi:hypothetical protein